MSLETHFFTQHLQKYQTSSNKIDKNLAQLLSDTVDAISKFLNGAEYQETDEKSDVYELIPSVDSQMLQAHRYYYCKPCNQSIKSSSSSFKEHFYGNKHLKRLREFDSSIRLPKKLQNAQQEESQNASKSEQAKNRLGRKERLNSAPSQVSAKLPKRMAEFLCGVDIDNLVGSLIADGNRIKNSQVHVRVMDLLVHRLRPRFPGVKIYPFGSTVIGMGRQDGDLDIFIDTDNCFSGKPGKRRMKDAIHLTQRCLMGQSHHWKNFEPVTHARTPILRVYCHAERIECDLSFSNGLSTCNTNLIGYFIELQPVCKKLAMFAKYWAYELNLGLNSYLISLMVIFYLQQERILPSVKMLQDACDKPTYIDGWRVDIFTLSLQQLKIPLITDFKKYLIGFFRFYGHQFNYDKHTISILAGIPIDKAIFDHSKVDELPKIFDTFKAYMSQIDVDEADDVEDLFAHYKPLVIQDPFELCHNVAKGVPQTKLVKIINFMQQSHEIFVERARV